MDSTDNFARKLRDNPQPQGLFQQKRSAQQVLDPVASGPLHSVRDAQRNGIGSTGSDEELTKTYRRKIEKYNLVNLETFKMHIVDESKNMFHFEGVLRFYFRKDGREIMKAVKLDNKKSVHDSMPILLEKFNVDESVCASDANKSLYQVIGEDEILLTGEENPVELALNSSCQPRFLLKIGAAQNGDQDSSQSGISGAEIESLTGEMYRTDHAGADAVAANDRRFNVTSGKYKDKHYHHNPEDVRWERQDYIIKQQDERVSGNRRPNVNGQMDFLGGRTSHSSALLISTKKKYNKSTEKRKPNKNKSSSKARASLRSNKSMGDLFQKTFSLRRKSLTPVSNSAPLRTELSIDTSAPGVLKIFGESVSPGAQYKSVLASRKSTAQELVKEALERYDISRDRGSEFVLCDVIGKFVEMKVTGGENSKPVDDVWTTECLRVVGDNEKPLILQSFWKPSEGYSRRFELRLRLQILQSEDVDTVTSGLNANARRMLIQRTCNKAIPDQRLSASLNIQTSTQTTSENLSKALNASILSYNIGRVMENESLNGEENATNKDTSTASYKTSSGSIATDTLCPHIQPPTHSPYFIVINGCNPACDSLAYIISEPVLIIGSSVDTSQRTDIFLNGEDILPQHCWVCRQVSEDGHILLNSQISLDPFPNAHVTINNQPIIDQTVIKPGDLIGLGSHYLLLYKDPTIGPLVSPASYPWLKYQDDRVAADLHRAAFKLVTESTGQESPTSQQELAHFLEERKQKESAYDCDKTRLKLSYSKGREDELLDVILDCIDPTETGFKLTPVYLICMCLEYCAVKYDQMALGNLLLKVSSMIQTSSWDTTKVVATKHSERQVEYQTEISELFIDMQPIIFWMSNAIELRHFLKVNFSEAASHLHQSNLQASDATDREEVVSVLEEVVMYTFQQVVYYLTKTLHTNLSAILESNPFLEVDTETGPAKPSVDDVIDILQWTLNMLQRHEMHSQITSQMFCYLFFFINASLVNLLMDPENGSTHYTWSRGVQLRGNLDLVMNWASQNHFHREAKQHMARINTIVNLLAMPKDQLLLAKWNTLQCDYPDITSAQLRNILSKYKIGKDVERPQDWFPSTGNESRRENLLESFNNHPPLVIPTHGFKVNLSSPVQDASFYDMLANITNTFGHKEDDTDSGLSFGQAQNASTASEEHLHDLSYSLCINNNGTIERVHLRADNVGWVKKHEKTEDGRELKRDTCLTQIKDFAQDALKEMEKSTVHKTQVGGNKRLNMYPTLLPGLNRENEMERVSELSEANPKQSEGDSIVGRSRSQEADCKPHARGNTAAPLGRQRPRKAHPGRRRSNTEPPRNLPLSISNRQADSKAKSSEEIGSVIRITSPRGKSASKLPVVADSDSDEDDGAVSSHKKRSPRNVKPRGVRRGSYEKYQVEVTSREGDTTRPGVKLKVMPLTTDDHHNQLRNGVLEKSTQGDVLAVNEANMDLILHKNTMTSKQRRLHEDLLNITDKLLTMTPDAATDRREETICVELRKTEKGLGLGLIDGNHTCLEKEGIYVRTIIEGGAASRSGELQIGDKILSVNGVSLLGADYKRAMHQIRNSGDIMTFVVAKGDETKAMKVSMSVC